MRCDGKRLKMPIYSQIIPYIETRRCDSQNQIRVDVDIDPIAEYISSLPPDAPTVSYMSVLIAAYVRALRKFPMVNRFIKGRHFYQRKEINVSFVMLKSRQSDGSYEETVLKLKVDPDATLFPICEQVNRSIEDNRELSHANKTDKLLGAIMRITPLVSAIVGLVRMLDYFGLVPRFVVDASPFHTGLFITNMMSIRTNYVYHHLYEFGTTSLFVSMGNAQKNTVLREDGPHERRTLPLGVVVDERVCSGYEYACFFREFESYMKRPKRLETLEN